ncbi:MAG: hypothetical protein ACOC4S_01965 [Balneolaceae bacterium]
MLLVTYGWVTAIPGEAQEVQEFLREDSLTVGDTFDYSVTIRFDQEYEDVILPDSSHFGENFELLERNRYRLSENRDSVVYHLQFFGTEDTEIPQLEIQLIEDADTTNAYTNRIPIFFKSVLASDEEEFRPFKPIFDFAATWWPYLLGLLLLGLLGWYLYNRYLSGAGEPETVERPEFRPTPFEDPIRTLAHRLDDLKRLSPESDKEFEQFYIQLGDAIRTYFEHLYHIPALESTSREIMYDLERRAVDRELITATQNVLREADMVKFARFAPTVEQADKALKMGQKFLERARKIDGPKVDQMRREHNLNEEAERKAFQQQLQEEQEEIS